jgi:CRISPR-associated protein Csx1
MKVVIAPWGNPKKWNEVTYVYNEQREKSKSSLSLIKKIENPDKIIIVCADTLGDDCVYFFKNPSL